MAERFCPYLGLKDDPSTYSIYPSLRNNCQHAQPPQAVNLSYQRSYCSTADYESCPVFAEEWRGRLPAEIRGERTSSKAPQWRLVLILAGVVLLGSLGAMEMGWVPFQIQWWDPTATIEFAVVTPPTKTAVPSSTLPPSRTLPPPKTSTQEMTLTPSPFPTPGPALETLFGPDGRYLIHLVNEGESYTYLEDVYNTSEAVITATNILIAETSLWPGMYLVILPGVSDPDDLPKFKVIYLDHPAELGLISSDYGISSEALREYNSLGEGDVIQPGRWLIIPQDRE